MREPIDHTADVGFVVRAPTREALFAESVQGMCDLICDVGTVRPTTQRPVHARGQNPGDVLRALLAELLYLFDTEYLLCPRVTITQLTDTECVGMAHGEPVDARRHEIKLGIKAVTHHQLDVRQTRAGWEARVIFDV